MKLMVIDGNSIVNRAYYGIRPLSTRDGLYTHAIYRLSHHPPAAAGRGAAGGAVRHLRPPGAYLPPSGG